MNNSYDHLSDNNEKQENFKKTPSDMPLCMFYTQYEQKFLSHIYQTHHLKKSYSYQLNFLLNTCYGESNFNSESLKSLGWLSENYIYNCSWLQNLWARENDLHGNLQELAIEQIKRKKPHVVYFHDINIVSKSFLSSIKPYTKLIVAQIEYQLSEEIDFSKFDLIISSIPSYIDYFKQKGITAYYIPLAFDPGVIRKINDHTRKYPVTYVCGTSDISFIVELSRKIPIDIWGDNNHLLSSNFLSQKQKHPEVWGIDMFSVLAQSSITMNHYSNMKVSYANNLRLVEATGCGSLLITEYNDSLNDLFEIGQEVIAYRSLDECVSLIKFYIDHPKDANKIAMAGQRKTLTNYTYEKRMEKISNILKYDFN